MKMIYRIGLVGAAFAVLAVAQDKVTVPLSNPSQPASVSVNQIHGSITVVVGQAGQVAVETSGSGSRRESGGKDAPPGMHRIDSNRSGLDVVEDHNAVTVKTGWAGGGNNVTLHVPVNTSVRLKSVNGGHIEVTGVSGEIETEMVNGAITLKDVSGSVVAHSVNGSITAALSKVTADKPMSFNTLNGKIDVTLPADTKARLRLKSEHGSIYSDFDVKLEPEAGKPAVEEGRSPDGKYRIRIDKSVTGTINGGGPEYRFESMNGNILIHKK